VTEEEEPVLSEREEIKALLPWYVTGRIGAEDRAKVEAALAREPALRHQLALVAEDRAATRAAVDAIPVPATLTADRLLARLPGATARPARRHGLAARLLADVSAHVAAQVAALVEPILIAPRVGAVRWAAAAALAVVVAQGAALAVLLARPSATYETASGGAPAAVAAATVLVRFAPGATLDAVGAELARLDMRILDGPKPGQLFVVAVGPADLAPEARARRADALRQRPDLVTLVLADSEAR
jgi:hypothetical protein